MNLGGSIGYFTGDPLRLLEDMQILRPTWFPTVPRVLNRIYQAANAAGDVPGFKGLCPPGRHSLKLNSWSGDIFRRAVAAKMENLRTTGKVTHPLWDRIVFKKVRATALTPAKCLSHDLCRSSVSSVVGSRILRPGRRPFQGLLSTL